MTWAAAVGYLGAAVLLGSALLLRRDDAVAARLPLPARHVEPHDLLASVGRRLIGAGARTAERLASLGAPEHLERVLGIKAALGAVGLAAAMLTWGLDPVGMAAAAAVAAGGWTAPDVVLGRRVATRRRRTASAVPEALDLVALAVGAGLSPRLALDRATAFVPGPLGEELRRAGEEVALGVPWEGALRGVAERTDARGVARLAATLARGRRLGTPLAEPLRRLAIEARAEERAHGEEAARRAPVAMLFPLVLCVLPAFVVAAVVPAVVVAIRGMG